MRRTSRVALARDVLCVDVGNSKLLAVLYRDGIEQARWRIDGRDRRAVGRAWQAVLGALGAEAPRIAAVISSVAPRRTAPLATALRRRGFRVHVAGWTDPWPFRIRLTSPQTVGTDRLANLAGLRALGFATGVAVDVGTAITIDVLSRRGFEGGLIAPGPGVALAALHAATEKLPRLGAPVVVPAFGRDTRSAVRAGVARVLGLGSAAAAASGCRLLGRGARVVLTGGAAPVLRPHFPDETLEEPDLGLLGLRLLAARLSRPGPAPRL